MGIGEPWKVLKGIPLFVKDHLAAVWGRTPQDANPLGAPLRGIIAVLLSACLRSQRQTRGREDTPDSIW